MRHQIAAHEEWLTAHSGQWGNGSNPEMIASGPELINSEPTSFRARPHISADRLLSLAAAPTFALMALMTGIYGGSMPDMLCPSPGSELPLSGMCLMYLLMSAFHLGAWLRLVSRQSSAAGR